MSGKASLLFTHGHKILQLPSVSGRMKGWFIERYSNIREQVKQYEKSNGSGVEKGSGRFGLLNTPLNYLADKTNDENYKANMRFLDYKNEFYNNDEYLFTGHMHLPYINPEMKYFNSGPWMKLGNYSYLSVANSDDSSPEVTLKTGKYNQSQNKEIAYKETYIKPNTSESDLPVKDYSDFTK